MVETSSLINSMSTHNNDRDYFTIIAREYAKLLPMAEELAGKIEEALSDEGAWFRIAEGMPPKSDKLYTEDSTEAEVEWAAELKVQQAEYDAKMAAGIAEQNQLKEFEESANLQIKKKKRTASTRCSSSCLRQRWCVRSAMCFNSAPRD